MSILCKVIYSFMWSLTEYPNFFHRTRTNNLKICLATQKTPKSKNKMRKKNGAGGIILPTLDCTINPFCWFYPQFFLHKNFLIMSSLYFSIIPSSSCSLHFHQPVHFLEDSRTWIIIFLSTSISNIMIDKLNNHVKDPVKF